MMKRYMLLLFESEGVYDNFSAEDMQREIRIHTEWIEELGEHYVDGDPLEKEARTVSNAEKVVSDGPFMESKELVSGYYLLRAHNLEEAVELAKGCPVLRLGGSVEVREIMPMDM